MFQKLDFPPAIPGEENLSYADIVDALCTPGLLSDIESIRKRYHKISSASATIPLAPSLKEFLHRLIWPLRHAKMGFMTGNYLGCIALCGFVAEMLSLLIYDFSKITLGKDEITQKEETMLFGSKFEKLGKDRRVKVLLGLKIINNETTDLFDQLRQIRRRYLHFYSQPHDRIETDAISAYDLSINLLINCLGLSEVVGGALQIRQEFLDYLVEKGIVKETNSDPIST